MEPSSSASFDSSTLTFRNYLNQQSSAPPSAPVVPPYQELAALRQELVNLSDNAAQRYEKFSNELARLDGIAGRTSASPNTSSPSSFSGNSRTGGSSGSLVQGGASASSPSLVKLGVVTLKLKRSDAAESSKTDDEQITTSAPNTIKIRTGTPSLAQDTLKKKKRRELDEDSEYSEDDRVHTKAKRSDDYLLTKTGRSMSPQPKPNTNRHSTPKAGQNRTGDKVHSASHQKKKKNADGPTEKSQKPTPKAQEVQEDFSKVKVANQVAIQTFWASMEPYFRPFTESDRAILEEDNDQVTPLLIPPLGRHYLETWAEEDRALMPYDGYESRRSSVDLVKENAPSRNTVYNQPFELTDENIEQDEVSCGPLTERIICSLIAGEVAEAKELKQDDDQAAGPAASGVQPGPKNYAELEERMKRELRYVGILGNEEIDWDAREDDEISITLRSLQKELREVMKVNKARKQRLLGLVNNHLAYQEYNTILDDLDKQVEQGYLKRFRMTKSKKKKTSTPKALSENALSAMDRRRRFVQGVGPIFPPENYTIPTKSIYQDELETKTTPSTPQSYRQLNGLP